MSATGATLSGSYSAVTGTIVEAGFKYGLSSGSLSSSKTGTYNNGSISASLSGLTAGTTYYYQAYAKVQGTLDYSSEVKTFTGAVKSFRTTVPTWLSSYEIPSNNASAVTSSDTQYNGYYSHGTVDEHWGGTKIAYYNTSNANHRIVVHTFAYNSKILSNYTLLYDKTKKCALWVAYKHNGTDYKDEGVGRHDEWKYDPALPADWQPNLSGAYAGNYDRGHQVASNDRQTTADQNRQTFYFSNMTPQYSTLNQGQWSSVEGKIQGFATNTGSNQELYVVTGPLFSGAASYTQDSAGADCMLPSGYYKCAVRLTYDNSGKITDAKGCAYIVETNSENRAATLTSIDAVESKTGFDFFANIPDQYEAIAESGTSSL